MSFVNFIVLDGFISVVSDGQITDGDTRMSISENYKKFFIHHNNFIVAANGHYDTCNNYLNLFRTLPDIEFEESIDITKHFAQVNRNVKTDNEELIGLSLAVAGFSKNKATIRTIKLTNGDIFEKETPSPSTTSFVPSDGNIGIDQIIVNELNKISLSDIDKILAIQKNALYIISNISDSVNKTAFEGFICKQ